MGQKSELHVGHRARMRERFAQAPESLAEHELLELLLYYAVPRRDTNGLAHTLIEEFASLSAVLEADAEQLAHIEGVGGSVSTYLCALGLAARQYACKKLDDGERNPVFDTPAKIAAFLWPRFLGQTKERVYALMLDNGMRLLDCFYVCEGSVAGAPISVRRVVERALAKGAAGVVLAHNHPGGVAVPSGDDVRITRNLDMALRVIEIPLIEHYVFSDRKYMPIMSKCRAGAEEDYAASSLFDLMRARLDGPKIFE